MTDRPASQTKAQVTVYEDGSVTRRSDRVVTEEPLEIRLVSANKSQSVAVTMRTPGSDFELAVGFLFGEGILTARDQVAAISYCRDDDLPKRAATAGRQADMDQLYNIVIVELTGAARVDVDKLERHFHMSSACGVCGKANLEAISLRGVQQVRSGMKVKAGTITKLPDRLRESQRLFESTGGLHAAGLFTPDGTIVTTREDVGRHNAVDKLVGWAVLQAKVPLEEHILMVSGRSSFEIAQKALAAGIPFLCSVSAPSSLAIDVAKEFGMTLVGFLRGDRFNVYAGDDLIAT